MNLEKYQLNSRVDDAILVFIVRNDQYSGVSSVFLHHFTATPITGVQYPTSFNFVSMGKTKTIKSNEPLMLDFARLVWRTEMESGGWTIK